METEGRVMMEWLWHWFVVEVGFSAVWIAALVLFTLALTAYGLWFQPKRRDG